ncbi:ABC-F family ATP-binding cassette domain-containing protein [Bdellovibrionota bacterium FG-1]
MLHLHGISKQYGSKVLFESAEAHIGYRSRVALIGPNGSGKSTLIRMILGQESPDGGSTSRASHLSIGHLAQEIPKFSGRSLLEEVMRMGGRREELINAKTELEAIFATQGQTEPSPAQIERYGRTLEELEHMDEYRLEARAKEILGGMGFKPSDWDRDLKEFSGGWLMRVALSRVLLMEPDLLLLDEPTNHLDLESLLWLEEFLKAYRGALLLVSHDSAFLNRMVHEVLEIDQHKLWAYRGNLDAFALQKQERLEVLRSQHAGQQARIAELENFIRRFGAKATKARQAQSRAKQLEKIQDNLVELAEDRQTVRFRFPPAPHSGREVITMRKAHMAYGPKTLFRDLDWVIQRGSRVAIVGVNGAGKTTLLKLIAGALATTGGEMRLGHQVQVGYYAQHQAESLDMRKTILEELEQTAPELPISQIRGIAGAFLFSGDAVGKKCGVLSGGEKARVALAKLLLSPSNFLVLDEPTNHLDSDSRAVLLEALQDYEGTLCVVSHDRDFVTPLVNSVLEIIPSQDGSGSQVKQLVGGYADYLARKIAEASQAALRRPSQEGRSVESARLVNASPMASEGLSSASKGAHLGAPSNNQKRAWEKERDQLEREIEKGEKRQAELHDLLADPATYEDKPRSMKIAEEQRLLESRLGEKLARWEEVCLLLG